MPGFSVDFFKEDDGTKPVGIFIRSLEIKMKAKVVACIIITTNGFVKKQKKTPRSEIELAKKRRKIHMARKTEAYK